MPADSVVVLTRSADAPGEGSRQTNKQTGSVFVRSLPASLDPAAVGVPGRAGQQP